MEQKGRTSSAARAARPRSLRRRFTAAARSGAVSASVPSKSNSTARLGVTRAAQKVVDVAVPAELVAPCEGVVRQADQLLGAQCGIATGARQLGRLDEPPVVMRSPGQ